jgi:hypothetical protein
MIGRRLGDAFEGRSEHDADGDATLHGAFDAAAVAAVLWTIAEEGSDASQDARDALEALAEGHPDAGEMARAASEKAVALRDGDETPYRLKFDVDIEIETRPHNQWVRAFGVKASPKG